MTRPQEFKVTFEPSGRSVFVLPGTTVYECSARAGLVLQSPCGGKGTCGKCRVRVRRGACEPTPSCRKLFTAAQLNEGMRLACQARVTGDCVVEIPDESLFEKTGSQILTATSGRPVEVKPAVWKRHLQLPEPCRGDDQPDLSRIETALGLRLRANLHVLRRLPTVLRASAFSVTAAICDDRLVGIEPGDTSGECYGVAFDLGTTTLVGVLIDLLSGHDRALAAVLNPQIASGDDVISRILRAREEPGALEDMQKAVLDALNGLIDQLLEQSGVARERVYEVVVAGNTAMQHLLCGISPDALGEVPFPPAYKRGLFVYARDVGFRVHPNATLYVFPNIGGFVGGDTVAGILAATMHDTDKPLILVDIGTNGEIVLAFNGRLMAASTAAGPAFEGARITNGMRATDGAIEKVVTANGDLACNVIGNTRAAGLCGTALIDVTAELLRLGVLDVTGRILTPDELPGSVPGAIRQRIITRPDGHADFLLVDAADSRTGEPVMLYQRDVRELQLASGAIRAGVAILLRQAGLGVDDVHEILLAGAFGNFIRRSNARRIGLLPPLPTSKIRFIGNASSLGAKIVLLSKDCRQMAEAIAAKAEHVDLSSDPEFQAEFSLAMLFPEDDADA